MITISESLYIKNEFSRIFKLLVYISIIIASLVIWDLKGLGAELTPMYISMKLFFALSPFLVLYTYKIGPRSRSLTQPVISIIYFFYCYYYTSTIHYSYYTSFLQFFLGLVFFFRFSKKSFVITYGIGLILVYFAVQSQVGIGTEEFAHRTRDIYGGVLPIYLFCFLVFFSLKKFEIQDEMKSLFFQEIGKNVGFLIHEIKQPIMEIMNSSSSESVENLSELLETANLIWPSQDQSQAVQVEEVDFSSLFDSIFKNYSKYLNYINVKIDVDSNIPNIQTNKSILKIILKNIVRNALEEIVNDDIKKSSIKIFFEEDQKNLIIIIDNSIKPNKKVAINRIFDAGFSGKSGAANKGIGLFITKQLAQKISCSITASQTQDTFTMKLAFLKKF